MASHEQIYTTKILLNSEQATKEIDKLDKKVKELKKSRKDIDPLDSKAIQAANKEIEKQEKKLGIMRNRLTGINKALDDMSAAGPKQLKDTIKEINKLLDSGTVERGSKQWKSLTAALKEANTELQKIKGETKAAESGWSRFMRFLNKNWGAFTQMAGAITGLTMTIRKSVQDYAQMEEEMADVRKYTGLADEQVRALNENLKRIGRCCWSPGHLIQG